MEILDKLGVVPNKMELYDIAFTHTSYSNEHDDAISYERLEFLGDAVLELIISEYLYLEEKFPEGVMTKLRASYVCEKALYEYGHNLEFEKYVKLGSSKQDLSTQTVIADVFEALIGAIYLDCGYDKVKDIVINIVEPYLLGHVDFLQDYKSELQECVQTVKKSVLYEIINEEGPPHNRKFTCRVSVDGIVMGIGVGSSKKASEQDAARIALSKGVKIQ